MRYKITSPNAKAYTFKKAKLALSENNPMVPNVFNGKLVYLGFKDHGFQPMIKVIGTSEPIYFFPKDVSEQNDGFDYGVDNMPTTKEASTNQVDSLRQFKNLYPQYSNSTGDNRALGEFTSSEVEEQYKKSGSKLSFGEWIQSEQGKKLVNDSLSLAFSLLNKNNPSNQPTSNTNTPTKQLTEDSDFTILNMKPLTFTLVSVVTIAAIVLAVKYIPKTTKNK